MCLKWPTRRTRTRPNGVLPFRRKKHAIVAAKTNDLTFKTNRINFTITPPSSILNLPRVYSHRDFRIFNCVLLLTGPHAETERSRHVLSWIPTGWRHPPRTYTRIHAHVYKTYYSPAIRHYWLGEKKVDRSRGVLGCLY